MDPQIPVDRNGGNDGEGAQLAGDGAQPPGDGTELAGDAAAAGDPPSDGCLTAQNFAGCADGCDMASRCGDGCDGCAGCNLLLVGLAADLNVFDSTSAEDMAQFAVLRVLTIPAIVLGISAWQVLAWGLHCVTLQRAALLRAFPHLDPITAFTRKRATDDDDSTHRLARPGDPVDQEESRRRARDAAHAVQDDD